MPQQACAALQAYLASGTPADKRSATDCPRRVGPKAPGPRLTVVGTLDGSAVDLEVARDDCGAAWGALLAVIAPPHAG